MSLKVWRGLCEFPDGDNLHTHRPSLSEIAAHTGKKVSTVRHYLERKPGAAAMRFARQLLTIDQPPEALRYLKAFVDGATDSELTEIAASARASPPVIDNDQREREGRLLRLFARNPDLINEFDSKRRGWAPGPPMTDWWARWGYPRVCLRWPKGLDFFDLLRGPARCNLAEWVELCQDVAGHICFPYLRRHHCGLSILRIALNNINHPEVNLLDGKEGQEGYVEAQEFLSGLFVPTLDFFEQINQVIERRLQAW